MKLPRVATFDRVAVVTRIDDAIASKCSVGNEFRKYSLCCGFVGVLVAVLVGVTVFVGVLVGVFVAAGGSGCMVGKTGVGDLRVASIVYLHLHTCQNFGKPDIDVIIRAPNLVFT